MTQKKQLKLYLAHIDTMLSSMDIHFYQSGHKENITNDNSKEQLKTFYNNMAHNFPEKFLEQCKKWSETGWMRVY